MRALGLRSIEPQLLAPEWEFYEAHLGRPVPPSVRDLFSRHDLILSPLGADSDSGESLNCFQPITPDSLTESKECYGIEIIPLALSESGDPVYLKPGDPHNTVYILHHDGGEAVHTQDVDSFVRGLSPTLA